MGPRTGFTCSELVASAYLQADPVGLTYALRLVAPDTDPLRSDGAAGPAAPDDSELEELVGICRRVVAQQEELRSADSALDPFRAREVIAGVDWNLLTITPKDLCNSPSLVAVGHLKTADLADAAAASAPAPPVPGSSGRRACSRRGRERPRSRPRRCDRPARRSSDCCTWRRRRRPRAARHR